MATTIVSGAIGIYAVSNVATQKRDVGLGIALLDPSQTPLVLLSQTGTDHRNVADPGKAKLAKLKATDPKIEWIEDVLQPAEDTANGAVAIDGTTITVTNGYPPTSSYLYNKRTGEIILVATGSTTSLTSCTRAALSTTAAAINDGDEFVILDPISYENDATPTAYSTRKVLAYNYLETIRTPLSMGEITQNTSMLGEERDWNYQKRKRGIDHAVKIERKFLFGGRSITSSGSQDGWTTGGLANMITTNVFDAGGTMTEKQFNLNVGEAVFKYGRGGNDRIILASDRLNSIMCGWGNDKLKLHVGDQALGIVINRYISPSGTFYVIPHHLITGTQGISGIVIDPSKIKYRYLQNMDTQFRDDTIKDGRLGKISEYVSVVGLEIRNQETCGIIKNALN